MKYLIRNARIITPYEQISGCVLTEGSRILALAEHMDAPEDAELLDAEGGILCPGFIDIHVHGGGGYETMNGTMEAINAMCDAHLAHGTTTILPTAVCAPLPSILQAMKAVEEAMEADTVLSTIAGIHLEGPYLSPLQAGAQYPGALVTPEQLSGEWMESPVVRMVGLAPELPGAIELGEKLAARGITVSVAHSNATYECVQRAVRAGYSDVTHLYSACSTVTREKGFRIPGVVEAGLEMDALRVQVIADGCHLPDALLRLIYKCKGSDGMMLITDAMRFACTDILEGEPVADVTGTPMMCKDGVMKLLDEHAFAGSIATTDRLLRTMVHAGIPLSHAIRMMTDTPARHLHLQRKGRIQPNYDADLVLMDSELTVRMVMAKGKIVFSCKK